jgi:hypothetical protein
MYRNRTVLSALVRTDDGKRRLYPDQRVDFSGKIVGIVKDFLVGDHNQDHPERMGVGDLGSFRTFTGARYHRLSTDPRSDGESGEGSENGIDPGSSPPGTKIPVIGRINGLPRPTVTLKILIPRCLP